MVGDDPRRPGMPRDGHREQDQSYEPTQGAGPTRGPAGPAVGVASGSDSAVPTVEAGSSDSQTPPPVAPGPPEHAALGPRSSWEAVILPGRLEPGQHILRDKYQVVRLLGKGGMGEVWLVHHRVTGADHALKLITSSMAFDEQVRARFLQEARVMARFTHPAAVTLHDADIGEEVAYILMEFVPGHSLYDELKDRPGPRPIDAVARLLKQLCSVLHRAHARGIVHRDLKPSNLMLVDGEAPGGDLKVLDFGIAKVLDRPDAEALTQTDHFLGTPYYASPEQLRGSKVDGRSDLYSVGVLLYELLAGVRPFEGKPSKQMIDHMSTPPPPFTERAPGVIIPGGVESLVLRCLAKDPADRPQTARDLYAEFLGALPADLLPSSFSTWGSSLGLGSSFHEHSSPHPGDSWESSAPETGTPRGPEEGSIPSVDQPGHPGSSGSHERFHPSVETPMGPLVAPSSQASASDHVAPSGSGRRPKAGSAPTLGRSEAPTAPEAATVEGASPAPATTMASRGRAVAVVSLVVVLAVLAGLGAMVVVPKLIDPDADRLRNAPEARLAPFSDRYAPKDASGVVDGLPAELAREPDGVEFVLIQGTGDGSFLMGDDGSFEDDLPDGDRPAFEVRVPSYYLQKNEVTIGEIERELSPADLADDRMATYRDCRDEIKDRFPEDYDRFPAAGVPIDFAARFAELVGGRLPTAAQWEFAARSQGLRRRYVWQRQDMHPSLDIAAVNLGSFEDRVNVAEPGKFSKDQTEQGIRDLTGNLREWCRDPYRPYVSRSEPIDDPGAGLPPIASIPIGEDGFEIRGSSFAGFSGEFRTTRPRHFRPTETTAVFTHGARDIGFRVVLEWPREGGDRASLAEE